MRVYHDFGREGVRVCFIEFKFWFLKVLATIRLSNKFSQVEFTFNRVSNDLAVDIFKGNTGYKPVIYKQLVNTIFGNEKRPNRVLK